MNEQLGSIPDNMMNEAVIDAISYLHPALDENTADAYSSLQGGDGNLRVASISLKPTRPVM